MSAVLPAGNQAHYIESHNRSHNTDWMRIGVGASLLTGSLLLLTGKRKAGLLLTAAGTALAMLDNREVVAEWWQALPQHLQKAQHILDQTQQTIDDLTSKRDKIFEMFGK
ncbi:hypothetical protein [Occallatibacter riparius]|uniref:Uncharacterized protein n=1 Tax=Occallatibacter riparius TaxID=1002689 RepID=A0A9J7BS72_9BACT|nr:hypothetical protein [Occallatibacter riparius]UWZ83893.1 hypothetical protein MOP44_25465 [Occallatibacter riparius]